MGRRSKAQIEADNAAQQNEENVNVTEENQNNSEESNNQTPSNVEPENTSEETQVENKDTETKDESKGDNEERGEGTSEEDQSKEVLEDSEKLISRISILEHTFDKKVFERGVYDVYQKGDMWIFKDRNGRELSTHFGEIETALKLFVVRMFPLDKRTKGSTFTWGEIE